MFLTFLLNAQVKIQGKVLDINTSKPISYADIHLPELKISATSNSDGSFYIEAATDASVLEVTKTGFEPFSIILEKKIDYTLVVNLFPKEEDEEDWENSTEGITLQTATITGKKKKRLKKKENPAYAILREVWKRKKPMDYAL